MKLIAKYDPPKIEGLTIKEGKCAKNTFNCVFSRQNMSEHVESKNSLFWKETEELLPSCKKICQMLFPSLKIQVSLDIRVSEKNPICKYQN